MQQIWDFFWKCVFAFNQWFLNPASSWFPFYLACSLMISSYANPPFWYLSFEWAVIPPPVKTLFCFLYRDCTLVDDGPKTEGVPDHKRYGRMKLLQFHENYRPAYWGTWSKKSTHVSPRCPLKLDKVKASRLCFLIVITQKWVYTRTLL